VATRVQAAAALLADLQRPGRQGSGHAALAPEQSPPQPQAEAQSQPHGDAPRRGRSGGPSLKGRALKYLAAREHSRLELTRKLAPHAESAEQVNALLDDFEAKGLLSAQRFVDSVLHRKAARFGAARLQAELAQHQLPPGMAREATSALRETEFERAHTLWARRYGEPAPTPQEQARQMRFLAARGFSGEVIRRVVRGEGFTQT
jgi:regulatory protein